MAEGDTIEEGVLEQLVQKLTPCIERGELDACVEEAARLAGEMEINAPALLGLAAQMGNAGKYEFAYVLALGALDGSEMAGAYFYAGSASQSLGNVSKAETYYLKAIEIDPNYAAALSNYAYLFVELGKKDEAETYYLKAIEADPNYAAAHSNYANLLKEFGKKSEAAIRYLKAIEIDPNYAVAHSNYAILLAELGENDEAETHYKKAIEIDPIYAAAHFNYANLLQNIDKKDGAATHYKKAIEIDPIYAAAHSNYANLLQNLDNIDEAVIHHLKAIEADPNYAAAYSNYAILLKKLNKKDEAATHYKKAIDLEPKLAEAHGAYGLLLIDWDKRDYALSETESASDIFKETGRITQSYLAKAWFYEQYSEKYFKQKEYLKSSSDAGRASDEYFKAAETADENLMEYLTLQGNVLKAKYFMRKIPPKPWYDKIHRKFGKKSNISDFVYNLQSAAIWYQKASLCPVDGKKDICTACYLSISTFSEVLSAINAFINGNNAEINKAKWLKSLESAKKTYADKELEKGIALVDSLKQLVKCADKLAEEKAIGLNTQGKRLWKCQDNLTEVNDNLDGVLGIISDHTTEAIRNYAQKKGMAGFVSEVNPKKSVLDNRLVKVVCWVLGTIISGIIVGLFFEWRIQDKVFAWIYNMYNM